MKKGFTLKDIKQSMPNRIKEMEKVLYKEYDTYKKDMSVSWHFFKEISFRAVIYSVYSSLSDGYITDSDNLYEEFKQAYEDHVRVNFYVLLQLAEVNMNIKFEEAKDFYIALEEKEKKNK